MQRTHVGHAHGIENPVEMVAFMLHHPGVEAVNGAFDQRTVGTDGVIPHTARARHSPAQAGYGETSFPIYRDIAAQRFDDGVDQHGQRRFACRIAGRLIGRRLRVARHLEDDNAQRHMHLRRREAGPADIIQGFAHIRDQAVYIGMGRVLDRRGALFENRMPHAGDFEYGHAPYYAPPAAAGQNETGRIQGMIAVIFEFTVAPGGEDAYFGWAERLAASVREVDGFLSVERFESRTRPGSFVSLSFWRDEAAVTAWRAHPVHGEAQNAGKDGVFSSFRLRVAQVSREIAFSAAEGRRARAL